MAHFLKKKWSSSKTHLISNSSLMQFLRILYIVPILSGHTWKTLSSHT